MTTSASNNYNATRDQILTRALRIVQAFGSGETPDATALTEASQALNDILAEWNVDGMPQWNIRNYTCTPLVAGTAAYNIGSGSTFNFPAPLKVLQAYLHNTSTGYDTPLLIITRQQYNLFTNKTSQAQPNQLFYQIPPAIQATGQSIGVLNLLPVPDATTASTQQLIIVAQKPEDDFDAGTDTIDYPPYAINALVWGVADQLAYEYGLSLDERGLIFKKMLYHKEQMLSFGTEEGSFYFQPEARWGMNG